MCEMNGHYDPVVARALITNRYKFIATKDDVAELYDLKADPYELTNLLTSLEHSQILADMQDRLREWQERTQDTNVVI